jgi:hypothetical protein
MPDIASLVKETEILCRAVAPRDLDGLPLYVVAQSQIAHEWGQAWPVCGYTTPGLDLCLAHLIPDYRGRGPCIVVNDFVLDPNEPEYDFKSTALHELAHVLERPALFELPSAVTTEGIARVSAVLTAAINDEEEMDCAAVNVHGIEFMRAAVHLCYRAAVNGILISPDDVIGSSKGASAEWVYEMALGDEPERRASDLFRDILSSDPPAEFNAVWQRDQKRIERQRKAAPSAA